MESITSRELHDICETVNDGFVLTMAKFNKFHQMTKQSMIPNQRNYIKQYAYRHRFLKIKVTEIQQCTFLDLIKTEKNKCTSYWVIVYYIHHNEAL